MTISDDPDPETAAMDAELVVNATEFKAKCLDTLDRLTPLSPEIAIDAAWLPGERRGDPADRLLIATSRHLGAPLVTRDARIAAYAAGGDVAMVAC
jgi:PIN domain nuclease of toxin-antitoxin system